MDRFLYLFAGIAALVPGAHGACRDIAPGQYRGALDVESTVTVTKTRGVGVLEIELSSGGETSETSLHVYTFNADCSLNVADLGDFGWSIRYDDSKRAIVVGDRVYLERV